MYRTLRTPVEAVLKKDGVGLADCAVAESKFEKGENITERMLALIPQVSEIQQKGTPDIEFAVNGLLARCQLSKGQAADARRTIETLRARFEAQGLTRFCRIWTRCSAEWPCTVTTRTVPTSGTAQKRPATPCT